MEERDNRFAVAALLLVAGGIIGAGVALLFAPQSGARTRRDLARGARKVRARADEVAEDLGDTISELVETVEDKTEDLLDRGKEVAGGARKELVRLIEEGVSALDKFSMKLRKM